MKAKLDAILSSVEALNFKISDLESKIDNYHEKMELLEKNVDKKFQDLDEQIINQQKINDSLQDRISCLEKVCADFQKEGLVKETYSKRLNLLIHGIEEDQDTALEAKDKTTKLFNHFLQQALKLDPTSISVVDIHRLPQHPVYKNRIKVNWPIIIKFQNVMDKEKVTKSLTNLKLYSQQRKPAGNKVPYVYVTDHLSKVFELQKMMLLPQFKLARKQNKKTYWRIVDAKYCLFVEGKMITPPEDNSQTDDINY